jgi:peptidyl serine alpha-galactosyltransferase
MPLSPSENAPNVRGTPRYSPLPQGPTREDLSAGAIHTVFSVDGSVYQQWQADLLAYSHRKVGQPGPLTRLLSADGPSPRFAGRTFHTRPYCPHPATGDHYPPYNRIMALGAWLRKNPPAEEVILLLEPDCVFLAPLLPAEPVSRGHPVSHPIGYMDPVPKAELLQKHCSRPELVDAAGIPTVLIHRDDLMELVPLWIEKTENIRNDPKSLELIDGGWIADMWGYTCAAAEIGLRHKLRPLARSQGEDQADLPIIHYCYDSSYAEHDWHWDKRTYRPWERVPDPPDEVPSVDKALIGLLNEWVAMPEHQICLYQA